MRTITWYLKVDVGSMADSLKVPEDASKEEIDAIVRDLATAKINENWRNYEYINWYWEE